MVYYEDHQVDVVNSGYKDIAMLYKMFIIFSTMNYNKMR